MNLNMHVKILKYIFLLHILVLLAYSFFSFKKLDQSERNHYKHVVILNLQQFENPVDLLRGKLSFSFYDLPQTGSFKAAKKLYYITFTSYLFYPVLLWFFAAKTADQFKEQTKRGARLVDEDDFVKLLPKSVSIPISDPIKIPKGYETRHFFIGGTSGTGKTNLISIVIQHLKARNEKVIVYDAKDGEFVAKFFNPKTDLIFNPFDSRSLHWNVFDMITNDSDFDSLAASVVPRTFIKDMFFVNAARTLLSGILRYCYRNDMKTNDDIWRILSKSIPELHGIMLSIKSEAAVFIENHESGQTQSVISSLMQYAKIFRYMVNPENKESFSVHGWLKDNNRKGTIFLTSNTKQRESLRGILSLFINSFANEILSLRDNPERRIFLIVDEFGTLHSMDSIKDLLALGRSKGCSFWIGIQEKSQLDEIYSRNIANTIINQCNNYVIFRMNDADSAEYFSKLFGEKEIEMMESTYSSGVEKYRDGEAYRNITRKERLILPSEIQAVPDLSFYLKVHDMPITKSSITYKTFPDVAPSFVNNDFFLADQGRTKESGASVSDGSKKVTKEISVKSKTLTNKAIDTEDKSPEIVRDDNKVKAKSFRNSKSYDPFSRE